MKIKEEQTLTEKAMEAMRASVRAVRDEHRRSNRPLATWEDGKVVYRNADDGQTVREDFVPYGTKSETE
ncbi:MAG: hypothetical protein EOM12_08880 [Verrucomicrobiae bacterium]|nr:hypothetical protein [Verrucomicrobiae bacterium]